ncbi:PHD finger-containing protein 1-like isoform X2 [Primulina tabacum]|uniref:PHD finger-containing protein 1-like isoform X2 n=1 Tax=Primulina tabacum TaxID=48773 RepID=UPI003F5A950C
METICLQCGNKGYDNAFVFCVKCVSYAVHRYCLDVIPEDFDEFVHWVCDDCEAKQQSQMVSPRKKIEKDDILSIETKEHFYEDLPQHLYYAYTKLDFVECPKAANDVLEKVIGLNNKENEKIEQNSQQLEQGENRYNKRQQEKLSYFIPLKANMKKKRSKLKKSTMKKDNSNSSKKPCMESEKADVGMPIKLASDDPILCEVKENKISELGIMETPMLSCNISSKSSKTKTLLSSEANSEGQNGENNVVELENNLVGTRTEGGVICTSNDHKENGGLEVGKEFPKDTNMLECSTCAEPIIMPIWSGSFNMSGKRHDILDGLKGHVSSKACQKVYEEISMFQPDLHLKLLPYSDVWPKRFELSDPNEDDIALFFFPSEISEPAYDQLIDEMMDKDLALKGVVQNAEILIFTSMVLPLMYWRFNKKYYLWGVFRVKQPLIH